MVNQRQIPEQTFEAAATAIREADALWIGAGAGMGVDSGLPDFRGNQGFWKAYPAYQGRSFQDIARGDHFSRDPRSAWGFYGHRLNLYRETIPHEGFSILKRWAGLKTDPGFVFTSNVDGQFQKAGFEEDRILECHGSIHHLQCTGNCLKGIFPAEGITVEVDHATMTAQGRLPACDVCGQVVRPNILMFYDFFWDSLRTSRQERRYRDWLSRMQGKRIVAIELGAGTAIPTVRYEAEKFDLIRINPRDFEVRSRGRLALSIPLGALEGLRLIDGMMKN